MTHKKITLNLLNDILYENNEQPILQRSFGRLKNYEFIQRFIPSSLTEYKDKQYDSSKIWGEGHNKSSLSKLINKEFIPKQFCKRIYEFLSLQREILNKIEQNFKDEWKQSRGEIRRLKETLGQIEEFNSQLLGRGWLDYTENSAAKPEVILTLLLLYSILSDKSLLLYPCPRIDTESLLQPGYSNSPGFCEMAGEYRLLYCSGTQTSPEHFIYSKLLVNQSGNARLYNNYNEENAQYEYTYEGDCLSAPHGWLLHMKDKLSGEYVTISLLASLRNFPRYLGLILALSASVTPVCLKIACLRKDDLHRIKLELLQEILSSKNHTFRPDLLAYEEHTKMIFFSDSIFK